MVDLEDIGIKFRQAVVLRKAMGRCCLPSTGGLWNEMLNIPHSRPEVDKELLFSVTGQVVKV